ncbi:hypothetical protein M409DRAFT_63129 [Zasmidium cellare ATCC 36951]|uniref:DUF7905 domain-containing protein n=1 Tax=Zasmidium cellare ATCC 36951 TaxID=1080233 RepID=A0A6A6CZ07_ZASCE|nr:uncharacterized protein M409DRAFT_63129 [Zasmidium cellare ATCC 36951]KAF2172447.1 hypothetical protein M409DRAFT_63129 [Zasmidium cellare ATCC 36951]
MDDYELERARAWDDSIPDPPDAEAQNKFEWQDVDNSKKKKRGKQPVRPVQRAPNTPQPTDQPPRTSRPAPPAPVPWSGGDTNRPRWPQRAPPRATTRWRQQPKAQPVLRQRQRLQPRPLIDHAESEATLLWRDRKPPACTVRIPDYIVYSDRLHNPTPTYEKLAAEVGTFIYSEDFGSGNATLEFKIWGDPSKAAEAKRAVMTWIDINVKDQKAPGSSKFPRVVSLTPKLRERAERNWARSLKRNTFRQAPPSNMPFECIGSFHWPIDEFRPEETFGISLEALDPIRMDASCYVTFDRDRRAFQVYGKVSDVQSALSRLRKTFFQFCARQISPVRTYLHHSSAETFTHVYLEDFHLANSETPKKSPRGEGCLKDEKKLDSAQVQAKLNISRLRLTMSNALHHLHYLRAHLQLRLRLGMFYLESYQEPHGGMYAMSEYENMTSASQFRGTTSEELGGRYIEGRLLKLVQSWSAMISPQEAMVEDLSEVRPSYSVEFVFDEESKGDINLSMVWKESDLDESGKLQFTEPTKQWTRLDRFDGGVNKLIDTSLTDLSSGLAWQFDLTSVGPEDESKISVEYRSFPDRVRLDPSGVLLPLSQKAFVRYNPFARLKSVRQIVRYHYMIIGTDYTLQISNIQDRTINSDKTETVLEPRWSLEVFRVEWDTMFGKNHSLGIGTKADWDDDIEEWFQKDWGSENDGFQSLMEKLQEIEKRVRDAAAEEDEGSMD